MKRAVLEAAVASNLALQAALACAPKGKREKFMRENLDREPSARETIARARTVNEVRAVLALAESRHVAPGTMRKIERDAQARIRFLLADATRIQVVR